MNSAAKLDRPQLALLDEGCRLFPSHLSLLYFTAALKAMHGDPDGAAILIEQGRRTATTDASREKFEQLRDSLRRRAEGAAGQ